MQNRMKTHGLTADEIDIFLSDSQAGRITTMNEDGYPYTVPVHFVYHDGRIYLHGLPMGQKISNLTANSKVCFETDEMTQLLFRDAKAPCNVNTEFQSVIILGNASMLSDPLQKREILLLIAKKYALQLADKGMTDESISATGVIEIVPAEITGKYYR